VAGVGPVPKLTSQEGYPASRGSVAGRAVQERRTVHVHDLAAESDSEYPVAKARQRVIGIRTVLATPLLRAGSAIGAFTLRRMQVRPFTDKQIALLETFAAQAVIAIENVRLFQELQARNAELAESLEQQTATSEILRVIASSPTDLQPVMDAVAENAARVCGAEDAVVYRVEDDKVRRVAHFGSLSTHIPTAPINRDSPFGRAILERRIIHIENIEPLLETEYRGVKEAAMTAGTGTRLAAPLMREGVPIGVIMIRRSVVQPFTSKQIALLETFADQAVIAIENVRLFQELQTRNAELAESLEQQTATGEILRVISRSQTDVQPVFDTIADNLQRLFVAWDAWVTRYEDGLLYNVAVRAGLPEVASLRPIARPFPATPELTVGRCVLAASVIHVADVLTDSVVSVRSREIATAYGWRSALAAPMLRTGQVIGTVMVTRREAGAFTEREIELIQTFADQAVIAIENVRLFTELQEKNRALTQAHAQVTESLEQQTATADILQVIASSPTDLQPVMQVVVENAARVCGATDSSIFRLEGEHLRLVARHGSLRRTAMTIGDTIPVSPGSLGGRVVGDRRTIHIVDIMAAEAEFPETVSRLRQGGSLARTTLATPLLREGTPLGVIFTNRGPEVHPFSEKQIALLETFANQAVIAIENVRLFQELEARNRDLTEALEQQTATSEVLKVISRSTFDLQPVLETLIESAVRLCGADAGEVYRQDGENYRVVASCEVTPEIVELSKKYPIALNRGSATGRAILERRVVHIPDSLADPDYTWARREVQTSITLLAVPMLRESAVIGVISVHRMVAKPFTDKQIELVTTFADQAVIAIENVRLFTELEARNRDLVATSEILQVISRSPTDAQPVFETIIRSAVGLCEAARGNVYRFDGRLIHHVAQHGMTPEQLEASRRDFPRPPSRGSATGRAILTRAVVHIDIAKDPEYELGAVVQAGFRTFLVVPMLRDGEPIGTIVISRAEDRPFSDRQIALLQTFADQAVIAVENVRLFTELEARTQALTRSVDELTALGDSRPCSRRLSPGQTSSPAPTAA
jgi:GAF domain-containing protein